MFWFFLQLDLIKVIASQRPVIAAASIVQRINVVFGDANQATKSPQVRLAAYVYHINLMIYLSILVKEGHLCTLNFGSRILMQWKGLSWGLKQLSVLYLMAQLIMERLVWRWNPNCTKFSKVSPNLTLFLTNYWGLQCAKFPSAFTRHTSAASFFKVDRT